jgi:hypothetical protein
MKILILRQLSYWLLISALVLQPIVASSLTEADVQNFLSRDDVQYFLNVHQDLKSELTQEINDYHNRLSTLDYSRQSLANTQNSIATSGNALVNAGLSGVLQSEQQRVETDTERANEAWTVVESTVSQIRQGLINNPPANRSETGPTLSGDAPTVVHPMPAVSNQTGAANNAFQWPDGKVLNYPDQHYSSTVRKVAPGDTLKIRAGPGTRFAVVATIPANGSDITVFDKDKVWDGDTWWYPVEWGGQRGYVGGSHIVRQGSPL